VTAPAEGTTTPPLLPGLDLVERIRTELEAARLVVVVHPDDRERVEAAATAAARAAGALLPRVEANGHVDVGVMYVVGHAAALPRLPRLAPASAIGLAAWDI
jgi:hypothetical protein